jgi:transcriptional antiterminator Rof (Rho-off)
VGSNPAVPTQVKRLNTRAVEKFTPLLSSFCRSNILEQLQEAEQRGAAKLILKQLHRQFETLPVAVQEQVLALSIDRLDALAESMADLSTVAELLSWLG